MTNIDPDGVTRALAALQQAHAVFHEMEEPGADSETVMVALNERDLLLVGMALPAMEILFLQSGVFCFNDASEELQSRIMELVRAQKPEWTT